MNKNGEKFTSIIKSLLLPIVIKFNIDNDMIFKDSFFKYSFFIISFVNNVYKSFNFKILNSKYIHFNQN